MTTDCVWHNRRLATLAPGLGLVQDGLVAQAGGKIVYAGFNPLHSRVWQGKRQGNA